MAVSSFICNFAAKLINKLMRYQYKWGEAWKHRNERWGSSSKRKPVTRTPKFEPQYTVEQFWCSPFREKRRYATDGDRTWTEWDALPADGPVKTGVRIFDEWIAYIAEGHSEVKAFCKGYGLSATDINSITFVLTGLTTQAFLLKYRLKTLDMLLRYTDMDVKEVARRSGFGSPNNLFLTCKREWNQAPMQRRHTIQKPGDVGRYRL